MYLYLNHCHGSWVPLARVGSFLVRTLHSFYVFYVHVGHNNLQEGMRFFFLFRGTWETRTASSHTPQYSQLSITRNLQAQEGK